MENTALLFQRRNCWTLLLDSPNCSCYLKTSTCSPTSSACRGIQLLVLILCWTGCLVLFRNLVGPCPSTSKEIHGHATLTYTDAHNFQTINVGRGRKRALTMDQCSIPALQISRKFVVLENLVRRGAHKPSSLLAGELKVTSKANPPARGQRELLLGSPCPRTVFLTPATPGSATASAPADWHTKQTGEGWGLRIRWRNSCHHLNSRGTGTVQGMVGMPAAFWTVMDIPSTVQGAGNLAALLDQTPQPGLQQITFGAPAQ